ncbi:MAG: hypothetical protein AB8G77_03425 [Rhodothermales bacterium]
MASIRNESVPALLKDRLSQRANQMINDKFKEGLELQARALNGHGFNYIVDVYTKWRGRYFYFIAKYRDPRENAKEEFFEVRRTRLEYTGNQEFSLAYMRHTDKWFEVFQGLTLDESLKTIEENELFWPVD